jgi:hypothetical protein
MAVVIKIKPKNGDGAQKPTHDDALELAPDLGEASTFDQISSVLRAAARGRFEPLAKAMLLKTVPGKTKLRLKALKNQLPTHEHELGLAPADFALDIARRDGIGIGLLAVATHLGRH